MSNVWYILGDKIDILLKATGDAPIMKKRKWAVDKKKKIGWIIEFIKKYIKSEPHDSLVSGLSLNMFMINSNLGYVECYLNC